MSVPAPPGRSATSRPRLLVPTTPRRPSLPAATGSGTSDTSPLTPPASVANSAGCPECPSTPASRSSPGRPPPEFVRLQWRPAQVQTGSGGDRQPHPELAAARPVRDLHRAGVRLDDAAGDGESESGTGRMSSVGRSAGRFATEAHFEDPVEVPLRNAAALVAHEHFDQLR